MGKREWGEAREIRRGERWGREGVRERRGHKSYASFISLVFSYRYLKSTLAYILQHS